MGKAGFTLIELIMIIVILGILAVVAIPRYIDLRTEALESAADGVVGAGNGGVQIWRAMYLVDSSGDYDSTYPEASQSACCFQDSIVPTVGDVSFEYDATNGTWSYTS